MTAPKFFTDEDIYAATVIALPSSPPMRYPGAVEAWAATTGRAAG